LNEIHLRNLEKLAGQFKIPIPEILDILSKQYEEEKAQKNQEEELETEGKHSKDRTSKKQSILRWLIRRQKKIINQEKQSLTSLSNIMTPSPSPNKDRSQLGFFKRRTEDDGTIKLEDEDSRKYKDLWIIFKDKIIKNQYLKDVSLDFLH